MSVALSVSTIDSLLPFFFLLLTCFARCGFLYRTVYSQDGLAGWGVCYFLDETGGGAQLVILGRWFRVSFLGRLGWDGDLLGWRRRRRQVFRLSRSPLLSVPATR
jgi:hypothetical protein